MANGPRCARDSTLVRLKANAFRKFAEVTNLLYSSRKIGTYTGDVDTFPDHQSAWPRNAAGVPGGVAAVDRGARPPAAGAPPRPETARPVDRPAACAYLSR